MAELIALNARNFARHAMFDATKADSLTARSKAELERISALLDTRKAGGFVRRCHGDLHLRNICLYEGEPLLFDAIEFSEPLACIDVLYDLAFLLMDLEHRNLRGLGNAVFNRYLMPGDAADLEGLAALPLFLSCRAAVRAHVSADAARQAASAGRAGIESEARAYLDLANRLLESPPPRLIAVGGLSGTGKSTLARALAPEIGRAPGALVLRSDAIRKKLFGADEFARLPEAGYTKEMTVRVYRTIAERAEAALMAGHSVVADAVYANPAERDELESVARRTGAGFRGLWLEAPVAELERRIRERVRDVSDATVAVLHAQAERAVGEIAWHRIDAGPGANAVLRAARAAIG